MILSDSAEAVLQNSYLPAIDSSWSVFRTVLSGNSSLIAEGPVRLLLISTSLKSELHCFFARGEMPVLACDGDLDRTRMLIIRTLATTMRFSSDSFSATNSSCSFWSSKIDLLHLPHTGGRPLAHWILKKLSSTAPITVDLPLQSTSLCLFLSAVSSPQNSHIVVVDIAAELEG